MADTHLQRKGRVCVGQPWCDLRKLFGLPGPAVSFQGQGQVSRDHSLLPGVVQVELAFHHREPDVPVMVRQWTDQPFVDTQGGTTCDTI